jgi:hypothetical protein
MFFGGIMFCGIQTFHNCPSELTSKTLATWCKINYVVVGKTNEGHDKKVSRVKYCETKPCELIDYLKPKLQEFLVHNFTSKWQEKEF